MLNESLAPTSAFTEDGDLVYDRAGMTERLRSRARAWDSFDVSRLCTEAFGDAIYGNMVLLGMAWQQGLVPLSRKAIEDAIALNGAAVAVNNRAFGLGRLAWADPKAVMPPATLSMTSAVDPTAVITERYEDLRRYQDRAYADRFASAVDRVRAVEQSLRPGSHILSLAVARSLYKLMAYKDEYEVARLYADPDFQADIRANFGSDAKLSLNLAPPLLASIDKQTGIPRKREFGPWLFHAMKLLAPLKRLRGGPLDPFGYTAERRMERALRDEFFGVIDDLVTHAGQADFETLVKLASLPQRLRGFGHVKKANAEKYRHELKQAIKALREPITTPSPAEPEISASRTQAPAHT